MSGPPPSPAVPPPPPPPPVVVRLERVSRWFGDVVAVSDVSFTVPPGVTALLGPNGAGKSTILRLVCGLTPASQGQVRVLGADPRTDLAVKGRIGLVPQQDGVLEALTALGFVRLAARLHGVPDPDGAARAALELVELEADDRRRITGYSKGMRQRVKLAQALVHDPPLLVLDEPLNGLDPRQRRAMIELFHRLAAEGRTVLVSSHVLDEVERFGSRVLVIARGRLAGVGDFRAIRDLMDDRPHRIRVRTDRPRELAVDLLGSGAVEAVRLVGPDHLEVDTQEVARFRAWVAPLAARQGARLIEVAPLDDDLESVFRYLVGR